MRDEGLRGAIRTIFTFRRLYVFFLVFLPDLFALSFAGFIAYSLRFPESYALDSPAISQIEYWKILTVLVASWELSLLVAGAYQSRQSNLLGLNLRLVFRSSVKYFLLIGFLSFVLKASFSRIIFLVFSCTGLALMFILRILIHFAIQKPLIMKKHISTRLMIIGPNQDAISQYGDWLMQNRIFGLSIISRFECSAIEVNWIEEFETIIRLQKIQSVLLIPGLESDRNFFKFISFCEDLDIEVNWIPLDSGNFGYWRAPLHKDGSPFLTFLKPELSLFWRSLKRIFDFVFSLLVLFFLTPFLFLISIVIYVSSGPPIIFSQTRIGYKGRPFTIYKFRTMVVGAESTYFNSENMHQHDHIIFKSKLDPRVTPFGRFLRKYSLDEIPQFFNVLNNSMSVVGPRPALPREVNVYSSIYERRLNAKPGITGPWQISGRSDLDLRTSVALDLNYLTNWSFTRDLWIIFATVGAIFKGKGAY